MKRRKPVRLDEVAEQDVLEARLWYERERGGLGDELLECLTEALESIERHPEAAARVEATTEPTSGALRFVASRIA